jgi:hypothetical protein
MSAEEKNLYYQADTPVPDTPPRATPRGHGP